MKASEIHTVIHSDIDHLQRKAKASAREQVFYAHSLEERQRQAKRLMDIIIKDGDRDLTGVELMELQLSKEDNNKIQGVDLEKFAELEKKYQ